MNGAGEVLEEKAGCLYLRVRVQPKASRTALLNAAGGRLRVAVTAPPSEGAANEALCTFLAKQTGVAKGAVSIVQGAKSREKVVCIEGIPLADAALKLLGNSPKP